MALADRHGRWRVPHVTQEPNSFVWRADIAARGVLRDSSAQASELARESARVGNWWGGPGVVWFGAALWLGARSVRRTTVARVGLRGVEALAVASAISGIIKGLAGRARPFVDGSPWHWEFSHGWSDARFFSMPSGHTTATTAFAVGILLASTGGFAAKRIAIAAPLMVSAVFVAWARMFTDQHWLSDVVVAMVLGAATSAVLARVHARRKPSAYDRIMLGAEHPPAGAVRATGNSKGGR